MAKRNDLLNKFFNELLDATVDAFIDAVEPQLETMARETIKSAKVKAREKVDKQGGSGSGTSSTHGGPRTRQERRQPPPPSQPPPRHPPMPRITLYDVLQVSVRASPEVIDAAYRSLSKKHHPDTGGSVEAMRMLTDARDVLKDPGKREKYDRSIGVNI